MASIVVTGASTGIGYGCVEELTSAGFHVYATVRKPADAERLTQQFGDKVTPLMLDVTDPASVKAAAEQVAVAQDTQACAQRTGIGKHHPHSAVDSFRRISTRERIKRSF